MGSNVQIHKYCRTSGGVNQCYYFASAWVCRVKKSSMCTTATQMHEHRSNVGPSRGPCGQHRVSSRQRGGAGRMKAQLSWEQKRNSAQGKEAECQPLQQECADAIGQCAARQQPPSQPTLKPTQATVQLVNTHIPFPGIWSGLNGVIIFSLFGSLICPNEHPYPLIQLKDSCCFVS